jgi:hypothetical protein
MTPRERIMAQLVIDGMRRFYRAVERVEKKVGITIDVYPREEELWGESGDKLKREHDEPYVQVLGWELNSLAVPLDSSYGKMVEALEKFAREDKAIAEAYREEKEKANFLAREAAPLASVE